MTQTPHEETVRIDEASSVSGRGLSIERVFSTEDVHPYDEVEWERRDVVQSNWSQKPHWAWQLALAASYMNHDS